MIHNISSQQKYYLLSQETMWDEVFPLLDAHFFCLIPVHLYECFLDKVTITRTPC